jgi:NADPH:quinone reductase-like Zn-dependent oxidoreductase
MSRTIKTIEHHMIPRSTIPPVRLGLQNRERKFVAEWQRGVEILGHAQRKLRLAIAKIIDSGKLAPVINRVLPLSEARRAHELSQIGHVRGKIVLRVKDQTS